MNYSRVRQLAREYYQGLLDTSEYRRLRHDLIDEFTNASREPLRDGVASAKARVDDHQGDEESVFEKALILEPQPQADELSIALSGKPDPGAGGDEKKILDNAVEAKTASDESGSTATDQQRDPHSETRPIEPINVPKRPALRHPARMLVLLLVLLGVIVIYRFDSELVWTQARINDARHWLTTQLAPTVINN